MCTSSGSNVIYHKFSHGAAFYTLKGENVNVMLELDVNYFTFRWFTIRLFSKYTKLFLLCCCLTSTVSIYM